MSAFEQGCLGYRAWLRLSQACLVATLLSGCVAFNVRIRTVVDERTACLRQIDYSGPAWQQFLLPTGGPWEVTRHDSGATVRALLKNPNEVGSDLVFDASQQVPDVDWLTFATERGVPEAKAQALQLSNRVSFKRRFLLIMYQYRYKEELDAHRIPEFLRYHYLQSHSAPLAQVDSLALVREGLRELARAFADCRLTCAVRLPGAISRTNADWVEGQIAVWDLSPLEFKDGAAIKVMEVTSRRYLGVNIALLCIVALAGGARAAVVGVRRYRLRHRDPLWRIRT